MPLDGLHRPALILIDPAGKRNRLSLDPVPFHIGRHADNTLVLRDNRVSRNHARVVLDGAEYVLEDLRSSHGTFVNGKRIERHPLQDGDRVEFGFCDSYSLLFTLEEDEIQRILDQYSASKGSAVGGSLSKLRTLVEVARAVQNSLGIDEVLASVVDGALTLTGCERGFLFLNKGAGELDIKVARDRQGRPLPATDLDVPVGTIQRALHQRRELLSMNFDPAGGGGDFSPNASMARLDLRSVVCVPLVQVKAATDSTYVMNSQRDTLGLLYLDSRQGAADLSAGNRELLQTLALEASTILENARLLDQERDKRRLEDELQIAKLIQASLLPRELPRGGWFQAAGLTIPSKQVGGDYFDLLPLGQQGWAVVVADVSGKGVSSGILASFLQGAFLVAAHNELRVEPVLDRINRFLYERTQGEKYATVFLALIDPQGGLRWVNAGHCEPLILRAGKVVRRLGANGLPVGMLDIAEYTVEQMQLEPGDQILAFSDGLSDAQDRSGRYFEKVRLESFLAEHAGHDCASLLEALRAEVSLFSDGTEQADDITALVMQYRGAV